MKGPVVVGPGVPITITIGKKPYTFGLNSDAFSLFGAEERMMETLAIREFALNEDLQRTTAAK
jgi:hypothetical protein